MSGSAATDALIAAGLDREDADHWALGVSLLGRLAAAGFTHEASLAERAEWGLRFPGLGFDRPGPPDSVLAPLLADPAPLDLAPPTVHDRAVVATRLVPRLTGRPRPLRVFDAACAAGGRLEAAYDRLVAWHWENQGAPPDLATARRLARSALHGVEPDPGQRRRARLRLGLRTLDGFAPPEVRRSCTLFVPGLLPDLGANFAARADPAPDSAHFDVRLRD